MTSYGHISRILFLFALLFCAQVDAREKTDVIYLDNGDKVTGEIEKMDQGLLQVKTDTLGTIHIEWAHIVRIDSKYQFALELANGKRIHGELISIQDKGNIVIKVSENDQDSYIVDNIVRITPIEDSFFNRIDGSFKLGASYTKASDVAQFNVNLNATYHAENRDLNLKFFSITTDDGNSVTSSRNSLEFGITRYSQTLWYRDLFTSLEQNDALSLDLRILAGAAIGRHMVQAPTQRFDLYTGIVGTRESFSGNADSESNVEALFGASYNKYVYDKPKVNISSYLRIYPSLTDWGRYRGELEATIRYELLTDVFFDLSIYGTYDSDSPSGSEESFDYAFTTSIGYSF